MKKTNSNTTQTREGFSLGRKILRSIICCLLLWAGGTGARAQTYNINSGSVNITANGTYTINGTGVATTNRIVVSSGVAADITLNNVNINVSNTAYACAFDMTDATVNLTLEDNNILKSGAESAGLQIPAGGVAALTITNLSTGRLEATGGYQGAGIGGGYNGSGGSITIEGGTVMATGGYYAAGIGGGYNGSGSSITIKGGTVTATNGHYGAGIGGGSRGAGGNITISGGTVAATAGNYGAGIGGGNRGAGGNIALSGGTVTATGVLEGAGIGGGYLGAGGTITISGGTVTANGGDYENTSGGTGSGAGIGGGGGASGGSITISGGTVTAIGGAGNSSNIGGGAGIGGGGYTNDGSSVGGDGGSITISGGTVIATGKNAAKDIGKGEGPGSDGTLIITGGSINATGKQASATNGSSVPVYLNTLTVGAPAVGDSILITAGNISGYGIHDVVTDEDGKVYFWLPASVSAELVTLTASGATYGKSYQRDANNSNAATLVPAYGITLSETGTYTFPSAAYGYAAQTAKDITVTNADYQETGSLTVAVSPSAAFNVSTPVSSIAAGATGSFTVTPKTGLSVGTHTATVTVSGGNSISEEFEVSFEVTKKDITIDGGTIAAKTYDGATTVTVTGVTFAGLENSETLAITTDYAVTSAAFTDVNAGSGNRTVRMTVTLLSTTKAGNYNLTNGTDYNLTGQSISRKDISVDGGTITPKTYDGTDAATVTGLTFAGLENSETLAIGTDYSVTSAAFTDASAGSGNRTVTMNVALLSTTTAGNYNLTNGAGYSLSGQSIAKKDITVTDGTIAPKTYDGTTAATVTGVTFDGLANGESLILNTDYTVTSAVFDNADAGSGNRTVTMNVTLQGTATAGNYNLTNGAGYSLSGQSIAKKDITVTGGTITPKTYDGTTNVTVTGLTFSGLENSETLDINIDYTVILADFTDANAGNGKTVQMTVTLKSNATTDNYNLINGTNYDLENQSITPASLTITNLAVENKTYDGTTDADIDGTPTLAGVTEDRKSVV
jgi:hypothetical protein